MSQENQGTSPAAPQTFPMKRKRGRPRKDGQINVEKVSTTPRPDVIVEKASAKPRPDVMTRNQRRKVNPSNEPDNTMVGQVVSGVLDGSFDAGYLLTVRVGDTDTILRGVVFAPGLSFPVSGANDVAPHVKMLKRFEIPLSALSSPTTQVRGSPSQYEQKSELQQRIEGSLPTKVPPPINNTPMTSKGAQEDTKLFPEAVTPATLQRAEDKRMNSVSLYSAGQLNGTSKVIQVSSQEKDTEVTGGGLGDAPKAPVLSDQQAAQSELQKEPAVKQGQLPEVDSSSVSGIPGDGGTSKGSKSEAKTESSVGMSLDFFTEAEHQKVQPQKQDQLIDVGLKYHTVGVDKTPTATAPPALTMGPITESMKVLPEGPTSEEHCNVQPESRIPADIPGRAETFHSSQSEADEATKRDEPSKLTSHLPLEIPRREAVPVLSHSVLHENEAEHKISNAAAPAKNENLVSKDAVLRAQSQPNSSEPSNTDSVTEPQNAGSN